MEPRLAITAGALVFSLFYFVSSLAPFAVSDIFPFGSIGQAGRCVFRLLFQNAAGLTRSIQTAGGQFGSRNTQLSFVRPCVCCCCAPIYWLTPAQLLTLSQCSSSIIRAPLNSIYCLRCAPATAWQGSTSGRAAIQNSQQPKNISQYSV